MRTTLTIDDDVLQSAKELARVQKRTAGQVISDLARRGIYARDLAYQTEKRSNVQLLPSRGVIRTPEFIQGLLDEEGI